MAEIVLGIGTSHSPLLTLEGCDWHNRSQADRSNARLTLADGSVIDYDQLVALRGEPYGSEATPDNFTRLAGRCQNHLDRIADAIEKAEPDVVLVIGDDQDELYRPGNTPAIAVYFGDEVITHAYGHDIPDWMKTVAEGYGMDEVHRFPGCPALASELISGLIDRDVDLSVINSVPDPKARGFGHAFGFPAERLFGGREIPMVPMLLNTYYPPNVVSARRAHDIGLKLREVLEESAMDLRVVILASGGLSHFVVEEGLDRLVLEGIAQPSGDILRSLPREALLEGSSEILNWVIAAGAASRLNLAWSEYEPIRRTPAGTGIGCAFAVWEPA